MPEYFLIACEIDRGGFSSERTFEIELPEQGKLVGTAYVEYLLDENGQPLDEDTPQFGDPIKGFVKCRKIRDGDAETVLIEVPSADVVHVSADSLMPA